MKKNLLLTALFCFFACLSFAGTGVYIEFKFTSKYMDGAIKVSALDGNSFTEMAMDMTPSSGSATKIKMASLMRKDAPNMVYMLTDSTKTYTEVDLNKMRAGNEDNEEYEITVLGKEKINNYNCTHVKVLAKKSNTESEMWLSTDIPDYASYTVVKNKYLHGGKFFDALKAKGAAGFVVQMKMTDARTGPVTMELVKAEKKSMPESMFSLQGYTKSAGSAIPPGFDMEKFKKMTPEEKKKFIEEMKSQHQ